MQLTAPLFFFFFFFLNRLFIIITKNKKLHHFLENRLVAIFMQNTIPDNVF